MILVFRSGFSVPQKPSLLDWHSHTDHEASVTISDILCFDLPSVLWRCWLGGRKGTRHVGVVRCWRGCLSEARCRLAYGPADATATHSLASVKSRLVLPFWLGGAIVRVQLPAVPFSGNNLGQVVHTRVCVIKQYNLVLVEGRWCPVAGKVTVGLASHWPSVTDFTHGWQGDAHPAYAVLWSMAYLPYRFILVVPVKGR